jgi:hypothetical protein
MITISTDGSAIVADGLRADAAGMDPDLSGCLAKLARAQEHLHAFDAECRRFFDSDPYRALGEIEGEHGWYVFRVKVIRQPPLRIGVLLGEYVHQVRSAFDHFAFALATVRYGQKTPPESVNFIIETSPKKFGEKSGRLKGKIPDDWFALIEALQPYGAHDDSLAILERFWNRDKHKVVLVLPETETMQLGHTQYLPNGDAAPLTERRARAGVRLVDDAELARVKITAAGPNPRVEMYVLTVAKVASEGRLGFFWDILPAESLLRLLLSVFPGGRTVYDDLSGSILLNRVYKTAITTLASEAAAEASGFSIPHKSFREPH